MIDLEMVKKQIVENHPDLTFASLVDGIIHAKGIKIRELAEAVGCNRKTITRICNGDNIPKKETAIAIGIAIGLNINQMDIFLFFAGYLLLPTKLPNDKYYADVILKTKGFGKSRIIACNIILAKNGKDNLLFRNYEK